MDRDSLEVFLPDPDDCYERLRRTRFGVTVRARKWFEFREMILKATVYNLR